MPPLGDIMTVLESDDNFSQLVTLMRHTDLEDKLRSHEGLTFFAPSNKVHYSKSNLYQYQNFGIIHLQKNQNKIDLKKNFPIN